MASQDHPKSLDKNQLIDDSHHCKNPQECVEYYNEWSKTYEDEVETLEYKGAELLAEVCFTQLTKIIDQKSINILDIGCGSGKVGQLLMERVKEKYGDEVIKKINIDGVDGSAGMLELARKKEPQIYRHLYEEILLVDQPSSYVRVESYDIVMGVGVFSPGHMSIDHITHFIVPAKKKSGIVIIGVRESWLKELNMEKKLKDLEDAKAWRLVEKVTKPGYRHEVPGIFFIYERV